ncbi:hypothetical protein ACN28S_34930 [Cystobacter fuscus]
MGLHPSSHHVLHEDDSHTVLHGLQPVLLCPWSRPVLAGDVHNARERLGSVSVEMPVRWLGGQLPRGSNSRNSSARAASAG